NTNAAGAAPAAPPGAGLQLGARAANDSIFAGRADDLLDGGPDTDACDGQAGTADVAVNCESTTDIP
ncbi:hypothetical protein ACFXA3_14725, partial [Streptomyces sp. NPDC059456]